MRQLHVIACLLAWLAAGIARPAVPDAVAPNFELTDLNGRTVSLWDYRGRLVLLNFWASWCGPCLEEMPQLSAWQRTYGPSGLQVIGISMDDEAASVSRFVALHPVDYPIVMGSARVGGQYGGILGLPQSFLINRSGVILARYRGAVNPAQIEAAIRENLLPTH